MTDRLDRPTVLDLLELHGELGEIGHNNLEESFEHLHAELGRMLHSDHSFLMVHAISGDPSPKPSAEASPQIETAFTTSMGTDADRRTRVGIDWTMSIPDVYADPIVQQAARGLGTPRTLIQIEDVECAQWRASAVPDLMAESGMCSRMLTQRPIDDQLEVTFGFDRPNSEAPFTERDRQLLDIALRHLNPLLRSFCQRRGFLPDHSELTPRERDVLEFLLGPLSEKEIAHELGLSTSWLHEVVISIYRKYNVRSRAELMSQWL